MIPSQMLKGMLEGCILEIINKQETYAYEISKRLSNYGFGEISEGYNIETSLITASIIVGIMFAFDRILSIYSVG